MTHDMAKKFWNLYIGMASKNGANVDMFNPTDNFKASAQPVNLMRLRVTSIIGKRRKRKRFLRFGIASPRKRLG